MLFCTAEMAHLADELSQSHPATGAVHRDWLVFQQPLWSLESLADVDRYLAALHQQIESQTITRADCDETVLAAGAYVGEVLRRNTSRNMQWLDGNLAAALGFVSASDAESALHRVVLIARDGEAVAPLAAAAAVLEDGDLQSVAQFVAEEAATAAETSQPNPAFQLLDEQPARSLHQLADDDQRRLEGSSPNDANVWGEHFRAQGAVQLAISLHFTALRDDPFATETLAQLGEAHLALEQTRKALAFFERALAIDPKHGPSLAGRGQFYARHGKTHLALADFQSALESDSSHTTCRRLAETLSQLGDHAGSAEQFRKLADMHDNDPTQRDRATADSAMELARAGSGDEAISVCTELIAAQKREYDLVDPSLVIRRAEILAALGRWKDAASDYVRAAKLNDECEEAYRGLAWTWAAAPDDAVRQPDRALQAAKRAVALARRDPNSLDCLAAAQARAGDFAQAISAQQEAIEKTAVHEAKIRERRLARLKLYRKKQPYTQSPT